MFAFAMIFDRHYACEGWAAQDAIYEQQPSIQTFVLEVDASIRMAADMRRHWGVTGVPVEELYDCYPYLKAARSSRPWSAYLMLLRPFLMEHILARYDAAAVAYIDSDVYFWGSPDCVFSELGSAPFMVTRSGPGRMASQGLYNGGFLVSGKSQASHNILHELQRNYLKGTGWVLGKQGHSIDEEYLEAMVLRDLRRIQTCQHPGINVLPNQRKHIAQRIDGSFIVDGQPLICFHHWGYDRDIERRAIKHVPDHVAKLCYPPYHQRLTNFEALHKELFSQ